MIKFTKTEFLNYMTKMATDPKFISVSNEIKEEGLESRNGFGVRHRSFKGYYAEVVKEGVVCTDGKYYKTRRLALEAMAQLAYRLEIVTA